MADLSTAPATARSAHVCALIMGTGGACLFLRLPAQSLPMAGLPTSQPLGPAAPISLAYEKGGEGEVVIRRRNRAAQGLGGARGEVEGGKEEVPGQRGGLWGWEGVQCGQMGPQPSREPRKGPRDMWKPLPRT